MWYNTSVFYQIYPLGFCGAPRENDGILAPRIQKVSAWANYLVSLGVGAVYFSPVFSSDRHGYDTRNYGEIDCRLGTNADFDYNPQTTLPPAGGIPVSIAVIPAKVNIKPIPIGRLLPICQHVLKSPEPAPHMVENAVEHHTDPMRMQVITHRCLTSAIKAFIPA